MTHNLSINAFLGFLICVLCVLSSSFKGTLGELRNEGGLIAVDVKDTQEGSRSTEGTAKTPLFSDEGTVNDDNDPDESVEEFIPTKEWKIVKPGQGLPRGLHIRMNLQTGQTEAKLMDGEDSKDNTPNVVVKDFVDSETKTSQDKIQQIKEIKDALRHIKSDYDPKPGDDVESANYRSMEQIKADFVKLKMDLKTDVEVMSSLLNKLTSKDVQENEKIAVLGDLEYYVHQFDNAQDFVKMGGLTVVLPFLNVTSEQLRAQAAFLLGSAMQSNPQVQINAIDTGAMQQLLRILIVDSSFLVKNRALYALSCLVRHFPYAQKKLIELGGLSAFTELFSLRDLEATKLQLKTVTLLNDLVVEQVLTAQHATENDDVQREKLQQYDSINLKSALVERGWCRLVPRLLAAPEHDVREKIVQAMLTFADDCTEEFQIWIVRLRELESEYRKLASEELASPNQEGESLDYFTGLYNLITKLMKSVNVVEKTEL